MAWSPLKAGDLRTRISVEHEVRQPNGQGGWTTAWVELFPAFAKKVPLRGDEISRDNMKRSVSTARFIIRYREDVTTKHRLIEQASGKTWNIRSIDDPFSRRDRVELDCESGVAT